MAILEKIECRICGLRKKTSGNGGIYSLRSKIDQYSKADQTERLYLWLQHRDLREEFNGLEETLD